MDFCVIWYDLDTWSTNIIRGHCISFDQRHHVGEVWAWLEQRERRCTPDKDFLNIILLWPSQFTLKIGSRSLHTLYSKALLMWSLSQIGVSRKYICSQKRIFAWSDMIFHPLPRNFMQGHCTSINDRDSLWVLARLDQRERRYAPDKDFIYVILLWP